MAVFRFLTENHMRSNDDNAKEKLDAEQVLKMLKAEGMDVTMKQAQLILDFLRKLATITVSNYLKTKQ